MAAAHGLAQRLLEMNDHLSRSELCEMISEEDRIIKSWLIASNQAFHKLNFYYLLRKTLLFVLTRSSLKEIKKKELLKGVSIYFNTYSNLLRNNMDVRKPVIDLIVEPWKNVYFSWDELFQRKISIKDKKVQEYFCAEPEEIVMARVHVFLKQGNEDVAMIIAKNSFLFHSRIADHFSSTFQLNSNQTKNMLLSNKCKKGVASMEWYLFILQKKKDLPYIVNELKQLTCHEGILLVQRLMKNNRSFAFTLLQILFVQELIRPSNFCCTKNIFCMWCAMHKEKKTSMEAINQEIKKMVAIYAPSSAHFYLLVDALWKQFGSSFITVYVELYVRGLTVDINHLEAAKNGEVHHDVAYLECHIASMFAKLSTLFSDFHEGAARECMFSAFSLKPTKERLYILQSLTHSILSTENEIKLKSSLSGNLVSLQECKCVVRCSGLCNSAKEHFLEHPILLKGIPNVSYSVVKDLVSVLEGVRCISFQYNLFDWRNNATDLGDYLKDFNLSKSWDSDTEYASEGSIKSDIEENSPMIETLYQSTPMNVRSVQKSAKRKSESDDVKEIFSLDVGANIEVTHNEFVNKRIKVQDQNVNSGISKHDIFNAPRQPTQNFSTSLGMEDAIENVIRMTLDTSKQPSDIPLNSGHNNLLNTSLNHTNDGTTKFSLSSVYKPISENYVYPYSLTTYGKKNNLNSGFKPIDCSSPMKSSIESTVKYPTSFTPKLSNLNQLLAAPVVNRESVISPSVNKSKKLIAMQEDSFKQMPQNKFLPIQTMNVPCYSRSNDTSTTTINNVKAAPVYHQREALNLGSKSNMCEQARNTSNTITQHSKLISNQTTAQVLRKSDISTASDISKNQFLPNTATASSSSMTLPVIQSKETVAAQHAGYPSSSHCVSKSSLYRTDSRYQVDKNSMGNTVVKKVEQSISCFQDNNFVHCDRSSVIQHTMQHVRESPMQSQSNDMGMPNQLSVSLNSNAVKQIRSAPKKTITNLPPFTVNVNDRAISNSSVAVSASLVIPRKPQKQIDLVSQPVCSNIASTNSNETITIPGILASQSVIVSPWEAQRKSHGELMYKKNINAINASTMDKRIYKNRPPSGRQIMLKPEPKISELKVPSDKNSNMQLFKAPPSHISSTFLALPSSNQNNANTSQVQSFVNNTSSQNVPASEHPRDWFEEPYPKCFHGENNDTSNEGLNLTVQQSTSSTVKSDEILIMQLAKRAVDVKPFTVYSKPIHPSNNSSISSTISYSPNNSISSSSAASSVLNNISIFSSPNSSPCVVSNENILHKDFISGVSPSFHPNNRVNIKTYSSGNNHVKNISVKPSVQQTSAMQLTTVSFHDKNSVQYTAAGLTSTNLHYSQVSPKDFSSCCSPSEVNPCQNCSLPAENNLVQSSSEKNSDRLPEQMIPGSDKMIPDDDDDLTSAPLCDSKFLNKSYTGGLAHSDSNVNPTITNCQYCSHPFLATELEMHILNSHSKEFVAKNNSFISEINSDVMAPENVSTKSLPLVPEQDSLFQKESFRSDLPQTKTFVNSVENQQGVAEDDKNLDEIEAHAFSACMDLINSDKDLKRIVQGIDSFHQMDNNYLPFIPSNDSSNNFLTSNLCSEVQEGFVSEAPVQNSALNGQDGEFNNFAECQQPEVPGKVGVGKSLNCVFEFTEREFDSSKPVQKLIHSKLQSSYSERISAHTSSKTSNELTFSALAEMIKVTITGDSLNGLESVETPIKDGQKDIPGTTVNSQRVDYELNCPFCSKKLKSACSLKRHIKRHTDVHVENSQRVTSPKLTDISSPTNMPDNTIQFENDVASGSGNSYNDNSDSLNHVLQSDVKPNLEISSTSEMCGVLPKGRIKGIIKSPTSQCKFCGKVLTSVYMKKHVSTQHHDMTKKAENSSSDINMDVNLSSPSQVDSANIPILSPLLEQDIDSSTCLSMSDALKRNNPYIVADTSNFSEVSDKLTENTDIKFNFNVLEFSKDAKMGSGVSAVDDIRVKVEPPENVAKFEENKIKCDNPYIEKIKFIHKQSCHLCSKAYTTMAGLNRHLKLVHNLVVPRSRKNRPMNNSVVLETKNAKKIQQLQSIVNESDVEDIKTANSEIGEQFSRAPPAENVSASYVVASLDHKVRERYKNSSPHANKSLLRAVLKSNFVSKQLEIKDWREPREIVSYENGNEKTNSCDTSESEDRQYNTHLSATICSHANTNCECLKGGTIDPELISSNKVCASVPFDSLTKTHLTESSKAYSYAAVPDTKVYNHSSTSSKFESSHLNKKLHNANEDAQVKYTTHTDSQNLSIQSNEISPISDIISNVSKCHFGGTSNNDNKEYFEDNSLKLLIPENRDESVSSKNDESIHQSNIAELIQKEELHLEKKENYMNASDKSGAIFRKLKDLTINEPDISTNEPDISVTEPDLYGNEPDLSVNEPDLSGNEPDLSGNEPDLSGNEPDLSGNEPDLSGNEPDLSGNEPGSSIHEHDLTDNEPGLADSEPDLALNEPDLALNEPDLTVAEPNKSGEEVLENESCELESTVHNSDENCTKCRLCHQNLNSMDSLSKHLKEVHNIPVLKKHISCPCSPEFSTCFQEPGKLSPPKLKLGTNESDSESVSDFDNPHSWSKTTNYSSEQDSSQIGASFEDNLCVLLSPLSKQGDQDEETILQNSQSKLKKSFVRLELAEKEVELGQSDSLTLQPLNHLNSISEFQPARVISSSKSKIRRRSLSESFDFKSRSYNNIKQKSASLPNLELSLHLQTPNDTTYYTNHTLEENKPIEQSAGENTTCSSVTDITEICKSSCDSSSSQNFPVQWNKILSCAISHSKSTKNRKMTNKILLRRLKCKPFSSERRGREKRNRTKCVSYHKKFKTKKTYKPIILTLKETREISEFLKTHKQPTVKLIRLKEKHESDCLINQKSDPVSDYNKHNIKKAVVKLERISIPSDMHDLVVIDQQLLVHNLLSQDTINSVTMQSHENQSVNCPNGFYLDSSNVEISHSEVSMMHENPPGKSIELSIINELDSNTTSSDSVQFLGAVTKEEKTDEFCISLKKCSVVLNRISV